MDFDRLGVEVDFFDFAIGVHHGGLAPKRNRERSIGHQADAWNVGMMDPLQKRHPTPYIVGLGCLFLFLLQHNRSVLQKTFG